MTGDRTNYPDDPQDLLDLAIHSFKMQLLRDHAMEAERRGNFSAWLSVPPDARSDEMSLEVFKYIFFRRHR